MSVTLGNLDIGVAFVGDASGMQAATAKVQADMEKFGTTSAKAMRQVREDASGAEQALSRLSTGLKGAAIGSSVAVAMIKLKNSIAETTAALIDAQVQLDKWNNGFKFGAGSMQAGAAEMAFVREEAMRLGLELTGAAGQYMKLVAASRGTALEGEKTRTVFSGIAQAMTVMGLSGEQAERAMNAVVQMLSKGKVSAEEMRSQFSEHIPGSMAVAARAMNMTEAELGKLMETGQLMSADFLPKFADQWLKETAPAIEDASKSMQASLNRASSAWLSFKQSVADSGAGDFIADKIDYVARGMQRVTELRETAKNAGGGFWAQDFASLRGLIELTNPLNIVTGRTGELNSALERAQENLSTLQERAKTSPDSPFFRVEIAQTRILIAELERAKLARSQLSAAPGPVGSVGSGDSALARANAADYDKRMTAYKALMGTLASPTEKFNTELAKQKALLGDLFTPEVEARLRANYIKPTKEAKASTDELTDEAKLYASALQDIGRATIDAEAGASGYTKTQKTLLGIFASTGFASMPDTWKETIVAQADAAIAAEQLAEGYKATFEASEQARKAAAAYASDLDRVALADADVIQKANEYTESIDERVRATEFEFSLMGQTAQARQIALKQYAIEIELQKQILAIKREMASEDEQAQAIARVTAAANRAKANAAAEVVNDEFQRTADQIEQSLTDALMRGFESGKDFAKNLRDTVVNMFKTLVLRPIISAVVNPVAGAITGSLGLAGAANAATGGGSALGTLAGALGPIALGIGALSAIISSTKGETRYGGQYGYSFDGTLADYRRGGMYAGAVQGVNRITGAGEFAEAEVQAAITGTVQGINNLLKSAGSSAALVGFQAGLETSGKGRGGVFSGGTLSTGATFGEDGSGDNYAGTLFERTSTQSPDAETARKNFALDLKQATVQALQAATDVPQAIRALVQGVDAESLTAEAAAALLQTIDAQVTGVNQLRAAFSAMGLEQFATLGFDAASALAAAAGGFEALGTNLASYYQTFYTEAERTANTTRQLTDTLAGLGVQMPATREAFRTLVEDTLAAGNNDLAAQLLALSSAFASVVPAAEDAAQATSTLGNNLADAAKALREAAQAEVERLKGVLQERNDLDTQVLNLLGDSAAIRAKERQAIDSTNLALFDMVTALQGIGSAAQAVNELEASLASASSSAAQATAALRTSLGDYIRDLTQGRAGTASPIQALQGARNNYLEDLRKAREGDADAARRVTTSANTYLDAQKSVSASSATTQAVIDQVLAELGGLQANPLLGASAGGTEVESLLKKLTDAVDAMSVEVQNAIRVDLLNGLEQIDLNGSQGVDWQEFQRAFGSMASEATLKSVFTTLDVDGDQSISKLEAIRVGTLNSVSALTLLASSLTALQSGKMTSQEFAAELAKVSTAVPGLVAGSTTNNPLPTDTNLNVGGTPTWVSGGGAISVGDTIYGTTGNTISVPQAISNIQAAMASGDYMSIYRAAVADGISSASLDAMMGWPSGSSLAWALSQGLPAFAVGTNYVPRDMVAQIHEGEAIVPKAYNPAAGGFDAYGRGMDAMAAEIKGLRAELQGLRAQQARETSAVIGSNAEGQQRSAKAVSTAVATAVSRSDWTAQTKPVLA